MASQCGSVQGDAAAVALRIQQLLAEREEAFLHPRPMTQVRLGKL